MNRGVASPHTDIISDTNDEASGWKKNKGGVWRHCASHGMDCRFRKRSDEDDLTYDSIKARDDADANVLPGKGEGASSATSVAVIGKDDLHSSASLKAVFTRQRVDPTLPKMNKTCVKAIIDKYGQTNLTTLSAADKKTLLAAILACINGPSYDTTNVSTEKAADTNAASTEAGERCPSELIRQAYEATHWANLPNSEKIIWWMILTMCTKEEPASASKLQEEQNEMPDPITEEERCKKQAVHDWPGNLNTPEDKAALMVEIGKCIHPRMNSQLGVVRDPDPTKDLDCTKRVVENWTGNLSTKEDRDALTLAIVQCIKESQTPPTNNHNTSPVDKRDECYIPWMVYYSWARSRLTLYVMAKNLDESRWNSTQIRNELLPCMVRPLDWYHARCEPKSNTGMVDAHIKNCWFEKFFYGGPGCDVENTCMKCGRDQPPHSCP